MLKFDVDARGSLVVRQEPSSLTVYLDHWALREVSSSAAYAKRLAAALQARGGDLALSWVNLVEFSKVAVDAQHRDAEALVETCLPHVFLLEVNPFVVIKRENALLAGAEASPPHADPELILEFIKLKPDSVAPFTARGLLAGLQAPERISSSALASTFVSSIEALRRESRDDPKLMAAALKGSRPTAEVQAATRYVLRELLCSHIKDGRKRITPNDAMDFFHAVVPASYCSVVLLDGFWADQINRIRRRLSQTDPQIRLARTISQRDGGITRLFEVLDEWE